MAVNSVEFLVMADTLIARLLDRATIDRAYPLARDILPGLTLDRWIRFVRPYLAPRRPDWPRGVMIMQNTAGYILGLFVFEVREDLQESRTLCVDNIIIPSLPGRDTIWASTIAAAEQLAKTSRCRAIEAGLTGQLDPSDGDRAWVFASLESSGYSFGGVRAVKRLETPTGSLTPA